MSQKILKCFLNTPDGGGVKSEIVDWGSSLTRQLIQGRTGSIVLDACCTRGDIYSSYGGEISAGTRILTLEGELCSNSDGRFEKLKLEQILSGTQGPVIDEMVKKYGPFDVALAMGGIYPVRATSDYHVVVLSCLAFQKPIFFLPKASALQKYGSPEKYYPRYRERLDNKIGEFVNFNKKIIYK